jgi:flagellar biosynthetic protein FliR
MAAPDTLNPVIQSLWALEQTGAHTIDIGLLLLCRLAGFFLQAPVFGRKDFPTPAKVGLIMLLTMGIFPTLDMPALQASMAGMSGGHLFILVAVNLMIGAIVGFIPRMFMETISAAGALANNQIGLSSANMLDPTTKTNSGLLAPLFNFLGVLLYLQIGGVELMLKAFTRTLTLFPLTQPMPQLFNVITMDYLIYTSGQVLTAGLLIAGPFFVVTMVVDLMLGIVNRVAQQIPEYQLSFATKPVVGILVFILVLPAMVASIRNFLLTVARVF